MVKAFGKMFRKYLQKPEIITSIHPNATQVLHPPLFKTIMTKSCPFITIRTNTGFSNIKLKSAKGKRE